MFSPLAAEGRGTIPMKWIRKLRFWISLWGGKFFLALYRLRGQERNDKPGMASMRLYGGFLRDVAKPRLTVVVTGTNGKTTLAHIVARLLRAQGLTVAYNDWGANHFAGQARCMLGAVSIFNRPTVDAVVVESDELISPECVPALNPDYIIVTNLSRDSILRNAHPEHIFLQLQKAIAGAPKATVILNADDPISAFLGESAHKAVYFGVCDQHITPPKSIVDDFSVCPNCGAFPRYRYRNARHIGDYYCPDCGLHAPARDYFASCVDYPARRMTVREPDGEACYPLISDALHNAYNELAAIAMFRQLGVGADTLARCMADVTIPKNREYRACAGGIELVSYIAKTQNPTATSTVFDYVSQDPAVKEIVWLPDEVYDSPLKSESVSWIYEVDCELLNKDNIRKIIVGGERYKDHRLRLLLAGIPESRIVCVRGMEETAQYVDISGIEKVYVLHDVNYITPGHRVLETVKARIEAERGQEG